jgi:hypothetical protein
MPIVFSLVSFSIAAAILIALVVVRSYRRRLREEQRAEREAIDFRDAELRRAK